jgi:glycosyltransferase involved in cell wall biosynthesis
MSDTPDKPQIEPLVSVIMPCYKMGRYIGEALEAIGEQTYKNWEVIAVDDCGPEDGTREIVEDFAKRFSNHRVVFHQHDTNQGVSAARNSAIALAQGELLAFLDPDDFWLVEHLANGISAFKNEPNVGATVSPVIAFWDDASRPEVFWSLDGWVRNWFPESLGAFNFIQPSGVMVRKKFVKQVGGFCMDKTLQHIEDYELWVRLVMLGVNFKILDAPTCRYRRHVGAASSNLDFTNKLHRELMSKYPGFFLHAQGNLISILANKIEQNGNIQNSFLMRNIICFDKKFKILKNYLFKNNG